MKRLCNANRFIYRAVFFFKQKTAYEFVSRDWSSDVCSSDLSPFFLYLINVLITLFEIQEKGRFELCIFKNRCFHQI